jgi:hypothetical protein
MRGYLEPVDLSDSQIDDLKRRACFGAGFRFFDVSVAIRTDSRRVLGFFERTYGHFLDAGAPDEAGVHEYYVATGKACPDAPVLIWDTTRACSLLEGRAMADSADVVIFGSVLRKIDTHILIHGAALDSNQGGVVLAGMSGSGKSTLALELARRGLRFGSDEIAAFSRATGLVHPFPRAIGAREASSPLLEAIDFRPTWLHHTTSGEKKWVVDIDDILPDCLAGVFRGKYLLTLDTGGDAGETSAGRYHTIRVAMKEAAGDVVRALGDINGVEYIGLERDGNFPYAKFRVSKDRSTQRAFLRECERYDELILYKVKIVGKPPDPERTPEIHGIPKMDAALSLLGNLQNMAVNDGMMSADTSSRAPNILYELLGIASDMECFRLIVGNLRQTCDLVTDLCGHAV